jgi:hypothetical protein
MEYRRLNLRSEKHLERSGEKRDLLFCGTWATVANSLP